MKTVLDNKQKMVYLSFIEDEDTHNWLMKNIDAEWYIEYHQSDFDNWFDHIITIPSIGYEDMITEDFAIDIINREYKL